MSDREVGRAVAVEDSPEQGHVGRAGGFVERNPEVLAVDSPQINPVGFRDLDDGGCGGSGQFHPEGVEITFSRDFVAELG